MVHSMLTDFFSLSNELAMIIAFAFLWNLSMCQNDESANQV